MEKYGTAKIYKNVNTGEKLIVLPTDPEPDPKVWVRDEPFEDSIKSGESNEFY